MGPVNSRPVPYLQPPTENRYSETCPIKEEVHQVNNGKQYQRLSMPEEYYYLPDVMTVKDIKDKLKKQCGDLSVVNLGDGIIYDDDERIEELQSPLEIMFSNTNRKVKDGNINKKAKDVFQMDDDKLVKMECSHYASFVGLIGYLKSMLCDHMATTILCPEVTCKKQWMMRQLRDIADLSQDEIIFFEAVRDMNEIQRSRMMSCPQCGSMCTRKNETNAVVRCGYCERNCGSGTQADFCFKCGDKYDVNHACSLDNIQHILNKTNFKKIGENDEIPATRLCPNTLCKTIIEHKENCKQMVCPSCRTDFCFVCLRINENKKLTCSGWYKKCETHPIQNVYQDK